MGIGRWRGAAAGCVLAVALAARAEPVELVLPKQLVAKAEYRKGDPNKPAVPWSTHPGGEVPAGHYTVPIGKAEVVKAGTELTIISYGTMVHVAAAAAASLGIDAEVIDVRTIVPLDVETGTFGPLELEEFLAQKDNEEGRYR